METIITNLALDFQKPRADSIVHLTHGDQNGRVISAELYNGGQRVDIEAGEDTVLLYAATDTQAAVVGQSCSIVSNKVRIVVSEALTAVLGCVHCVLQCYSGSGIVHTARFDIIVSGVPTDGKPEVIDSDTLSDTITALVTSVQAAETDIAALQSADDTLSAEIAELWQAIGSGSGARTHGTSLGIASGTAAAQIGESEGLEV